MCFRTRMGKNLEMMKGMQRNLSFCVHSFTHFVQDDQEPTRHVINSQIYNKLFIVFSPQCMC